MPQGQEQELDLTKHRQTHGRSSHLFTGVKYASLRRRPPNDSLRTILVRPIDTLVGLRFPPRRLISPKVLLVAASPLPLISADCDP
jgi:hypothetical protein